MATTAGVPPIPLQDADEKVLDVWSVPPKECFDEIVHAYCTLPPGRTPRSIEATAQVHLDGDALAIKRAKLSEGSGLDEATFGERAEEAKEGCPLSKALVGVEIELDAALASDAR